jgi:hypothetical protein
MSFWRVSAAVVLTLSVDEDVKAVAALVSTELVKGDNLFRGHIVVVERGVDDVEVM